MQKVNQAFNLGHPFLLFKYFGLFQGFFPFDGLLPLDLFIVELSEVVDNDGDGEGHHEDPGDGTAGADELAEARGGVDVPVAHSGHRDDGPPERGWDGGEASLQLVLLGEVAEAGENEDAHGEEEHQEAELLVAVFQCEGYGLEASGVSGGGWRTKLILRSVLSRLSPGQLEYPHDSHDSEHLNNPPHVVECGPFLLLRGHGGAGGGGGGGQDDLLLPHDEQRHVVRHDRQHVYHVHGALHELPFLRCSGKPEDKQGSNSDQE